MCGIFCIFNNICNNCDGLLCHLNHFEQYIQNRGPNSFKTQVVSMNECSLVFAASVLWLQGKTLLEQPCENSDSIFVYNGDVFRGFDENLQREIGDTNLIHKFLKENIIISSSLQALSKVHGPYSFVLFDKLYKKLYFGRDIFGRRSLLIGQHKEDKNTFVLTSVAKKNTNLNFMELPSVGVFCYDILSQNFTVVMWPYKNKNFSSKINQLNEFLGKKISVVQSVEPLENDRISKSFIENKNFKLLKTLQEVNIKENVFDVLLKCASWLNNVQHLNELLNSAISRRIATQPEYCKNCLENRNKCDHAITGILFSGGVDCAILALLCDKFVDKSRPIDLINVSFNTSKNYQSPDRLTGRQTLEELKNVCPKRKWKFLEVNVTKEELDKERERHIADLIYPLNTILDDSLGCALWFASRGVGEEYVTPCRVLLVGMGADELFGGYTRHRAALKRQSWQGLQEVLDEDWQNLPYRNLGRDDRVVSDHGRQLRTPYLDENVVNFAKGLKCWERTYPSEDLPQGIGEKILLRSLAHYLGLKNAASLKKRALQFGCRIAHPKENAHEVSLRLCS